jgi:hypothetical protein
MAITNVSSLESNFFVNGIAVGCAGKITFKEETATDQGNNANTTILCRADYRAIEAGDPVSTAGTWTTTTPGPNSFRVIVEGIVRNTTGPDVATNMTYRQLIELKDAGSTVIASFGTGKTGDEQREGPALITRIERVSDPKAQPAVETFTVELLGVGALAWVDNP